MEKYFRKYRLIVFLIVASVLLYPTLQRGYIMLLDWSIWPFVSLGDINWKIDPMGWALYKLLAFIFTPAVFQRIFLLGAIVLSGMAGFRLAKKTGSIYAQYFAGLFLIFNPFIYARLIEQTMIVGAGVVSFFWFLVYFLEYLQERRTKKLIVASLIASLAVSFFAHSLFFIGVSCAVFLIFDYFKKKDWRFVVKTFSIMWAIILILNLNWIISSLKGGDTTWAGNVKNFTQEDLEAFQTKKIGGNSVYVTVLALQGYWGEYQDRFVSVQKNSLWSIAFVLILALSVFGAVKLWKKDVFVKPLLVLFVVAFVLAIGVASPLFEPVALFFYRCIPFYIGLREPQKWVAVLVFVYAYMGSRGIKYFLEARIMKNYRIEVGIFCAILPVIFSFSIIGGMHEHFVPREFPPEWQEAKKYLGENLDMEKVLFFPWHSYMKFNFSGKNIINPARTYFGENIVQGNNIEFGKVYSNFGDDESLTIEKYVLQRGIADDFSADMKKYGFSGIILAKAEDWRDYNWLDRIKNIKKVLENDELIIYKINGWYQF
jgi:hypothetical protein